MKEEKNGWFQTSIHTFKLSDVKRIEDRSSNQSSYVVYFADGGAVRINAEEYQKLILALPTA